MKQMKITCDGCDKVEMLDCPVDAAKPMPDGWEFAEVEVNIGTGTHVGGYDLCLKCQKTLVDAANPKTWPRTAPTARKFDTVERAN